MPGAGKHDFAIHRSVQPDQHKPFPWFVNADGSIGRQDFWKGQPTALIGFQRRLDVQEVDIDFRDFVEDPTQAVGTYAVCVDDQGSMAVWMPAVERVDDNRS